MNHGSELLDLKALKALRALEAPEAPEEFADIGIGDDILIVDDSPTSIVAIDAALRPLGRKLVFARSGSEALGRLLAQDFALILLDVAMPGITGIETARLIRMRERSRGTPIIFVTGRPWHDAALDEAYQAGGDDFLMKPVRAEILRAKARVFLTLQERTRRLRQQAEQLRESQAQLYEHELLIDVARAAAGLLELSPETVNVTEIVRQALDHCRPLIEARKLSARFDADASVIPLVMGDPFRLLQSLTTLIDHAALSTGECGQIVVRSRVASGDVVVSVANTGRGIALKLLPKIFDTFRGDDTASGGGGLSLALALVKRLIELHDGAIHASSDGIGKGSTFEVRLPLAPQDVELSSLDPLAPQDADL